ncbi:MAG TPA: homocysteine S-methyltransferase family protein, partial [Vicinamibacterales bacterium]|nr:homocysteine S-methyltransferase family protein [Vicinamibacterales bacterium]
MKKPFLDALDERVLVCDGAMGTMLYARGVFINRCFESLNQTHPDLVVDVHAEYLKAGSDVIETNTFGANRMKLRAFGLGDQVAEINRSGATLARQAIEKSGAQDKAYVAGAIGPLGVRVEPWGKTGVDEAEELFREQAKALHEGGVDLFVLETFRDLNEIGAAIAAVRSVCDLPIVAQMTTEEDGFSLDGAPPEQFAPELIRRGASVVGINCSVGPAPMLETVERISDIVDVWLSAQPNAGKPRDIEGRNLYLCSPEYMASYARRFIASGVRLVGGCCGTTPEHIRQIALAAKSMAPGLARHTASVAAVQRVPVGSEPHARTPVRREEKSALAKKLVNGGFIRAIELVPPRGHSSSNALHEAARLAKRGVDVVTIPDGLRSGARMSALSMAVLVQQHAAVEALLQYSCRDRNLLGIQSDLL